KTITTFLKQRASIIPEQELERLEGLRIRIITWKDKSYPNLLKEIDYVPPVLYICGTRTKEDDFALAVVGTRKLSVYGRQITKRRVTDLAKRKVTIVNDLPRSINTVAHT